VLDAALDGLPVDRATSVGELAERLRLPDVGVLVLPYGSAFPVDAWPQIQAFLHGGGGLAVLGGAPLAEPVRAEDGAWVRGPRASAFAHDLLIGPAEPIAVSNGWRTVDAPSRAAGFVAPGATELVSRTTWALTLRLTRDKEFPDEHGSAGPRDAVARPLLHVVDAAGTPRGCPLLEVDRLRGSAAGARWVFATTDARLEAPLVRAIVSRALEGASELRATPVRASIAPGAKAEVRIELTRPRASGTDHARATASVTDAQGARVFEAQTTLRTTLDGPSVVVVDRVLPPGLYRVEVTADGGLAASTGFWVKDQTLLESGPTLSASRDWLRKDGRPFPVVGTTYMASDVHRHFLFEPNPAAWDADFAAMHARGIGFVRTGIWTAWSRMMAPPAVDDAVLSALEAFVQTAAKHGIVVCFNLFAFLPPTFGGTNPYLDPRSIAGQIAFAKAFAGRLPRTSWIHWDLINEPSYAPLARLWQTRPVGDAFEAAAWKEFVRSRHGASEGKVRALWRTPEVDPWAVPREEDFAQVAVQSDRRPRKTRDFREFVELTVTRWAGLLAQALRASTERPTLVTLGQDEGGIYERPTQQLMAGALDYTAVHTWWKNDDLLWDGVVTKVAGKPNLHQETGLMRLEDIDGAPWRTPDGAALLLERKIGYAFAGRGAGVVEWVWNVNPLMPLDEESTIGLFRPDGTAKPELDVLERFARFFAGAATSLDDFEPDPVVMVIPHARAFLGMAGAIDSTKEIARTLSERFGVVPAAVSDLRLGADDLRGAKLVIVSRPDVLDERAARALLEASRSGVKVLVTGPIEGDSYGLTTPSLTALGVLGPSRPVAMREKSPWSADGWVTFGGMLQESARRSAKPPTSLVGNVWHEPLPLELAREPEPLARLLRAALAAAKVEVSPDGGGVAGRVLLAPKVALLVAVNERAEAATRRLFVDGRPIDLPVRALGASVMLVDRRTGKPIAR
jgi:hypothetical protein